MEILGISPSELAFIVLIAIIILGPKDMQQAGKTIGRWLNRFIRSDGWKALQRASKEIRDLPTNLMREANIEELQNIDKEIRQSIDPRPKPPISSSVPDLPAPNQVDDSPQPPAETTESQSAAAGGNDPEQK
jgi:Sec-independent protein translocase protein TatA